MKDWMFIVFGILGLIAIVWFTWYIGIDKNYPNTRDKEDGEVW